MRNLLTLDEQELIDRIAARAERDITSVERPAQAWRIDLMMAHAGCPLRLESLLEAPAHHFDHDMIGIARHLNRDTGRLGWFLPDYADRQRIEASPNC